MLILDTRHGAVLADPLLQWLPARDLSLPIFALTYAPILWGIVIVVREGAQVLAVIYSYALLQIMRLTTIFMLPLEPPELMVLLSDPIADHLVFGTRVTKDLFFSGHVSAIMLFSFFIQNRRWRWLFRWVALADAVCLLVQHVHYSIDVFAAPMFALTAYSVVRVLMTPKPSTF